MLIKLSNGATIPMGKTVTTSAHTAQSAKKVAVRQTAMRDATNRIAQDEAHKWTADQHTLAFERNDRATVQYDQSQVDAVNLLLTQQYACISGPAGTGKTTIVAGALERLTSQVKSIPWTEARTAGAKLGGDMRPAIALCTFTNVAARNLASKLPVDWSGHCMSVHSLLCYAPHFEKSEDKSQAKKQMFKPRYDSTNRLPYDIIIIDEGGIIARDLWHALLDACEPHTRIYMLGDLYQLPAIQGVSPLPFAINSWPTAFLTKIYRQADGSPIVTQAHNIRQGLTPQHVAGKFLKGRLEHLPESGLDAQIHVQAYILHLFKQKLFDPDQDIIIVPQNGTILGQENWNNRFHFVFNPLRKDPETGVHLNPPILIKTSQGAVDLCVGDKVMATSNGGRNATEHRLNNGAIAVVTAIYPNPKYKGDTEGTGEIDLSATSSGGFSDLAQMFSDVEIAKSNFAEQVEQSLEEAIKDAGARLSSHIVEVTEVATGDQYRLERSAEISTLKRAYAVTCHKFQGSQARRVIVIIHSSFSASMLSREWLYTACTRAREAVILLHDSESLLKCLSRQEIKGKDAKEKAQALADAYAKAKPWDLPRLPQATPYMCDPALLMQLEG